MLGFGNELWIELALDFAGDFKLGIQALIFLGDLKQLLEVLRHAVERVAQLSQLIATGKQDAMREVAFHHAVGALVEVVHCRCDGACQSDTDDEGDDLKDQEKCSEKDEGDEREILIPIGLG